MLSRNHDGINALWNIVVGVLYGNLALRVWTKISHHLALLADSSQLLHDQLSQVEGNRHVVVCLIGSITEHHALVASTLVLIFLTAHATVDVVTLLMDSSQHTTRVAIKLVLALGVTDVLDGLASDGLQIHILCGTHLTHDDHLTCGTE